MSRCDFRDDRTRPSESQQPCGGGGFPRDRAAGGLSPPGQAFPPPPSHAICKNEDFTLKWKKDLFCTKGSGADGPGEPWPVPVTLCAGINESCPFWAQSEYNKGQILAGSA